MAIGLAHPELARWLGRAREELEDIDLQVLECDDGALVRALRDGALDVGVTLGAVAYDDLVVHPLWQDPIHVVVPRSEENTSELQSLMRISYAVFCLKKKKTPHEHITA